MPLKYSLLLSICLYFFLLFYKLNIWLTLSICVLFLLWRTKKIYSFLTIFLFLYFVAIPTYDSLPNSYTGKVYEIHEKYVFVKCNDANILLYTNSNLIYDEEISFDGEYQLIDSDITFYNFDFKKYCNDKNIYYSISPSIIHKLNSSNSLRGKLLSYIYSLDEDRSILLKDIIFHIKTSDTYEIFSNSGLSYTAILYFIKSILDKFLNEDLVKIIQACLCFLLCIFYHFPFVLVQYFIFQILSFFKLKQNEKVGLVYLIVMILYPTYITSISFLIPLIYRIIPHNKELRFLILSLIQSIKLSKISLIKLFCFRYLIFYVGLIHLLGWLSIVVPLPLKIFIQIYESIFNLLDKFTFKGNPLGLTFLIFILCIYKLLNSKKGLTVTIVLYYLFLSLGLFHPFGEVCYMNVGQGDSVLIRYPFNLQNILIDTGKESKVKNVISYLDANSISKIDHLIITHYDEDHSGGIDSLKKEYNVKEINDIQEDISFLNLKLYELNTIKNGDTNECSLVFISRINGLNYLFMGDATSVSEKEILKNYPALQCDILKAGHHGSKTSSCEEFIQFIKPNLCIFSSGAYSIYNHPSSEVVERMDAYLVNHLCTREDGDIRIVFLPFCNLLITASHKIMIIR